MPVVLLVLGSVPVFLIRVRVVDLVVTALVSLLLSSSVFAQDNDGQIRGTVIFADGGERVHGATVLVIGVDRVELTDEDGEFVFQYIPAGTYAILAQREHLTAERQTIVVEPGQVVVLDLLLGLSTVHESITVTTTASGGQTTTFEAFNATDTIDSFDLATNPGGTLAEAIDNLPGVAMRGLGPGSARPMIRGFDGDRVLVMEDGVSVGDLSSSSAEHGVGTDPNGLDRIEIVRGPATLLYGSSAVGGVVNAITPSEAFRNAGVSGIRGQVMADGGTANDQAGTFANMVYGNGPIQFWTGGGMRKTGDYVTPSGTVKNSATELSSGRAGFGYAGEKLFFSGGVTFEDSRFGVPEAGEFHQHGAEEHHEADVDGHDDERELLVDIDSIRRVGRFDIGMRNVDNALIESVRVVTNVVDYRHNELELEEGVEGIATAFDNRSYTVRADVTQQSIGPMDGRFGVWAKLREFKSSGEEALAPATDQVSAATFLYEELDFGRFQVQFGGRLERTDYRVGKRVDHEDHEHGDVGEAEHADEREPPIARDREFLGGSASIGFRRELTPRTVAVANVTRSHRAPALEELYNFGAHIGNLTYEIGNSSLNPESTVGLDLSLRHLSTRVRGDINVYRYDIENFVFFDVENEVLSGLPVAKFMQGDGRFVGVDGKVSLQLWSRVWANVGVGLVNAQLASTGESLPRIPPLRGQLSVDVPYANFTFSPEVIIAAQQKNVFRNETATNGYSVTNLKVSYILPTVHMAHIVSATAYNLTNALYRHHTSVIKDFVPQIGRGVRVSYSVRFF